MPPGTVVDTEVVHPNDFDFWICSHLAVQGTSRPTHYYVLKNDCDLNSDQLQLLTYNLCYLYYRCPSSVSIPAPVYYASLASERARILATDMR